MKIVCTETLLEIHDTLKCSLEEKSSISFNEIDTFQLTLINHQKCIECENISIVIIDFKVYISELFQNGMDSVHGSGNAMIHCESDTRV
jgi:hypothetical protein